MIDTRDGARELGSMAEANYSVLDEDVDYRPVDIGEEPGNFLLEVKTTRIVETDEYGHLYETIFEVLESDNPKVKVGTARAYKVFDCFAVLSTKTKGLILRKMRGLLSALTGKNPDDKEKWSEIAQYSNKSNIFGRGVKKKDGTFLRNGAGVKLWAKVGPKQKTSRKGTKFYEVVFSNAEGEV